VIAVDKNEQVLIIKEEIDDGKMKRKKYGRL